MLRIDITLALLLALIGTVGTLQLYGTIKETRVEAAVFVPQIPFNPTVYAISWRGKCVGRLSIGVARSPDSSYLGESMVRAYIKRNGQPIDLYIHTRATFNPIGQLYSSNTELSFGEQKWRIETSGVSPIQLSIIDHTATTPSLAIPGPILIKDLPLQSGYQLAFTPPSSLPGANVSTLPQIVQLQSRILNPVMRDLALITEPALAKSDGSGSTMKCANLEAGSLSLEEAMSELGGALSDLGITP